MFTHLYKLQKLVCSLSSKATNSIPWISYQKLDCQYFEYDLSDVLFTAYHAVFCIMLYIHLLYIIFH